MLAYLVIAAAVLPALISANLPIIPCPGHADVAPSALRVDGCSSFPCYVGHDLSPQHGHNFNYQVDFMAHFASQTLTLSVYQTAFGETIPVSITDANACNSLVGANCPVQAHQMLTQGTFIEGEDDLHGGIPVQMRIEITDDDHLCMCALIDLFVN